MLKKYLKTIAHRGASFHAPENTLAAFKKALDIGVDGIELDIHLSKDLQVIVIHDETLERTTSGRGRVENTNLFELQNLDAGLWFSKDYKNEKIPTLEAVLNLIKGKCELLIEVKSSPSVYPRIIEKTIDIIVNNYAENWCVLQSFCSDYIFEIEKQLPTIKKYQLVEGELSYTVKSFKEKYGNISALNPYYPLINKDLIENLKLEKLKTYPYTVNNKDEMQKLIELGVDGIITDRPDILLQLIQELNEKE